MPKLKAQADLAIRTYCRRLKAEGANVPARLRALGKLTWRPGITDQDFWKAIVRRLRRGSMTISSAS